MKKINCLISVILILSMALSGTALAAEAAKGDIIILATNDIHNSVDAAFGDDGEMETMGYANLAAYVNRMKTAAGDENVVLIDAGDAVQGEAIGTLSKGSYIIDIMNYLEYDLAVPGNHEFDYGMDRFLELTQMADFPYIASNFIDLKSDETVFDAYKIFAFGDVKVAFVGVVTPESFSKSDPTAFQDESGNYIYSLCELGDASRLYENVQGSVNAAIADGADYVIAATHLGVDEASVWTSKELIANTDGIDAVIDGHSHTIVPGEAVANKNGDSVWLVQAGSKLAAISKLTIKPDGSVYAELVSGYDETDAETGTFIEDIQASFAEDLNKVVASSEVGLYAYSPEDSEKRLIRNAPTNLGDLCADAYRTVLGADIAFVNGGGIRTDISAGDITYGQIIAVHPYGNMMCVVKATGQQILDALELGSSAYPNESGGFLHVSGLTYTIDATVPSGVLTDDRGGFLGVTGARRVKDVTVAGEELDPGKTYTLASHNYMLKSGGDGFNMFMDCELIQDEVLLDNQVLINYITDFLGGVVGEEYADTYGQGRINIASHSFSDVNSGDWFAADVLEAAALGLVSGITETTFAPEDAFTRAALSQLLYRLEGAPETGITDTFSDVKAEDWFAKAVAWSYENGIVSGYEDGSFSPNAAVSRQDAVAMLYRYALYKNMEMTTDEAALEAFTDRGAVSQYAEASVRWAVSIGLLQGDSGALNPQSDANRAQGVVLILRFVKESGRV